MAEPTVSDMVITDEHFVVPSKTKISDICARLAKNPNHAVLVKKGEFIVGVLTSKDIFSHMADGGNPLKTKVDKIMRTEIMSIQGDMPLSKALDEISSSRPDAIIVTDSDGIFIGYFSPSDYRDATRKLESHLLIVSRLKKSRKVISEKQEKEESQDDLLGLLLGDNEDDEYDEVEVPSMISLE